MCPKSDSRIGIGQSWPRLRRLRPMANALASTTQAIVACVANLASSRPPPDLTSAVPASIVRPGERGLRLAKGSASEFLVRRGQRELQSCAAYLRKHFV